MFSFGKVKERTTSAESISQTELEERPGIKRHGTLQSLEVFQAWAKESFLRESTIDIMVKEHEIDCIPAVLALKQEDIAILGLPVGQQRLLEGAVEKLKEEYELVRPPTPITKINLDMPAYRSMLEFSDKQPIPEATGSESSRSFSSYGDSSREVSRAFLASPDREELLKNEAQQYSKSAGHKNQSARTRSPTGSPSRHPLVRSTRGEDKDSVYSCQRFLLTIVFMPFFLIISLLGVILWLLMAPFLICCPRDGCYANLVTDMYEHTVMAPWRACRWASTKRSEDVNSTNKTTKYGGTIDEEMGRKK